jgi:hypothetical protein
MLEWIINPHWRKLLEIIMTSTWRYFKFGLCLAALFLFSDYSSADINIRDSLNDKSQQSITKGVLHQQIGIVPQLNKLNFGLGRYAGINFYYKKSLSKIFFQDRTIEVKITDIEFDDMKISLNLFHSVLGAGNIQFVFDEDLLSRASDEDLQKILLTTIGDENNKYVFADPVAEIFHLHTGLHTQDADKLVRLTKEEAKQKGYRECAFCFKNLLYLPDLAVEIEIEREWSERLRDYEPLMDGSTRQLYLRNLGERVLRNWPLKLMGYDYSFQLIKSRRMNAIAIPTGKIVVSTALMESLENDKEVEALLVLAIAHIEKRHSLKQYQLRLATGKKNNTIRSLFKAAGSAAGMFPGGSLIGTIGSLPFNNSRGNQPSVLVFEEDYNKEADDIAALYFDLNYENRDSLSALIRKMQIAELAQQLHPQLGDEQKEFHFNHRIKRVENTKFLYSPQGNSFVFKKNNRLPIQLDVLYQSVLGEENHLLVYLSDKSLLPAFGGAGNRKEISLLIQDRNGKHEFKLLEKFTTEDLWGAQLTLKASGKKNQGFIREIESVKLLLTETATANGRREDQFMEYYTFVVGKLDY